MCNAKLSDQDYNCNMLDYLLHGCLQSIRSKFLLGYSVIISSINPKIIIITISSRYLTQLISPVKCLIILKKLPQCLQKKAELSKLYKVRSMLAWIG